MYYNTSVSLVAYIEFEVDLFDINILIFQKLCSAWASPITCMVKHRGWENSMSIIQPRMVQSLEFLVELATQEMLGEENPCRSHPHADFKYVYRYVNSYPPTPAPNLSSFYKSTHDLICWFYFCLFPCINHLHGISYCQTVKTLFLFVTFKHSCINVYSVKKTLCLSVGVLSHYSWTLLFM